MAARSNPDSFLEEFSPLSEALIATTQFRNQTAAAIMSYFITIGTEKCFKPFASRFFKGIGNIRVSAALDEIRGMATFRNVHSFAHDISDKMSIAEIKEKFFFGSNDNLPVVWDYCILAKLELDNSEEERDESDEMQCEIFQKLSAFYERTGTFAAYFENEIMDLFRYFCGRDMILEANNVLGTDINIENTELIADDEEMETESILHDDTTIDTLSDAEKFYLKYSATNGKEVYAVFDQFKTDGVDISKIDHLLMLKSKSFYQLEKKKGLSINLAGLMFSEEESIAGWINRNEKFVKMRMPTTFDELEKYDIGHTLECFHNLNIEIINAEIKALHHSALLFFEKAEIKEVLFGLVTNLAIQKNTQALKMGKLSNNSNQKNAIYKLPSEDVK